MEDESTPKNRDAKRENKANAAVRGCVYADINHNCIDTLRKNISNQRQEKLNKHQIMKLLDVAYESSNKAKRLLLDSQSSISKRHCARYASSQFNQLKQMSKNNEDISNVSSVSSFIVNDDMITMAKDMGRRNITQTGKGHILILVSMYNLFISFFRNYINDFFQIKTWFHYLQTLPRIQMYILIIYLTKYQKKLLLSATVMIWLLKVSSNQVFRYQIGKRCTLHTS